MPSSSKAGMSANDRSSSRLPRITTGVPALDEVLDGGLPKGSVTFVVGLPGTGKSVLSAQALWANAWRSQRVLYLSTLSEPMIKMLQFMQTFSFFKPELLNKNVVYADLGATLANEGTAAFAAELDRLVQVNRPDVVVLDSFKVLRDFERDDMAHRRFVSDLMLRLGAWEVTTIFVGEYDAQDIGKDPEFAVADGIIYLHGTEEGLRQKRWLRIMKMRGTDFFAGDHFFEITEDGFTLYPRMRPEVIGEYAVPDQRVCSAVDGLDAMLGGGLQGATGALILGESGSGKTLTALSFATGNGQPAGPVLYVSFEESPEQLLRNSETFGWDAPAALVSGQMEIMHISPSELDIDRHAVLIKERARATKARLVILDSISSLEASIETFRKFQAYLWGINDHFKRHGIAIIMTSEASVSIAKKITLFADVVIELRLHDVAGEAKRTVRVKKVRGGDHDKFTRELIIEAPRLAVGDRFAE